MDDFNTQSGLDSWPVPVEVIHGQEKWVRLTGLPLELKQKAWREICAKHPALATLLKEQSLKDIVDFFDADIFIEPEHAPSLPLDRLRGRIGE
jgi:hypothetical protein